MRLIGLSSSEELENWVAGLNGEVVRTQYFELIAGAPRRHYGYVQVAAGRSKSDGNIISP